jgi:2-hydroxychromene-2-carboxylate isomerase
MSSARRLMPYVTAAFLSPRTRLARRWLEEGRRRLAGAPHRVRYFHQPDDPYSQLAAQVLGPLVERYDVTLEVHLAGPPSDDAAPERERLESFSRKDAADVAPFYGLQFPANAAAPSGEAVAHAARLLAGSLACGNFVRDAPRIGAALWSGDAQTLDGLAAELPAAEPEATQRTLADGTALRDRTGHYLGATFHYGGEWYWGVDRLHFLEQRLEALALRREGRPVGPIVAHPAPSPEPAPNFARRLRVEYFPSLRSPYSAIAMARVFELPKKLPVEIVLRPVLPMVMRGLAVPRAKLLYISLDAKREAELAGEAFGRICDPVGRPIERAFSLYPWAREQGRAAELLHAFTRAAFSEGVDTGTDAGLRHVVERAGLCWEEARPHLDASDKWREELEENRRALFDSGLWGVPSFRILGDDAEPLFCTWGQDRLWLVEQELRRRLRPARLRAGPGDRLD